MTDTDNATWLTESTISSCTTVRRIGWRISCFVRRQSNSALVAQVTTKKAAPVAAITRFRPREPRNARRNALSPPAGCDRPLGLASHRKCNFRTRYEAPLKPNRYQVVYPPSSDKSPSRGTGPADLPWPPVYSPSLFFYDAAGQAVHHSRASGGRVAGHDARIHDGESEGG